jgi:hypothetical protein
MSIRWIVGSIALALTAGSAAAAEHRLKSLYTTLEPKTCKLVRKHPDGNAYACNGLPGFPVYFAEGDLRAFLSYGPKPERRRAATQTLGPFNTPFEGKTRRTTVEWRFNLKGQQKIPYATIVRYAVSRDNAKSAALVVARVGETDTCHVAYVDAKANPDAIMMARRIADEVAPGFDCAKEPTVAGLPGLLAP